MSEIRDFLERHLQAILDSDVANYHATTVPELSLYEWYIVPQRIDGIPFHDYMMTEAARSIAVPLTGTALAASEPSPAEPNTAPPAEKPHTRFDLSNYREQLYGDTAIASYTMLLSTSTGHGVTVRTYNESRVIVKLAGAWKVVHVHKSPTYRAPLEPPK